MSSYRFLRLTHKYAGIFFALILLNVSVTGMLLLGKKAFNWIQPATQRVVKTETSEYKTIEQILTIVFDQGHSDFQDLDDIDRIDFRPGKGVHKVRSMHHNSEMQVDAVTGNVLSVDNRLSDLLEDIHDGSFFGEWVHLILMPLTGLGLIFLTVTGLYLWLRPVLKRRFN